MVRGCGEEWVIVVEDGEARHEKPLSAMTSFYGTQTYAIDHKGRLSIPAPMRREASGKRPITEFLLIASFEGCLALHTFEQWRKVEERLERLAMGNRKG